MKSTRARNLLAALALVTACGGSFLLGRAQADQPHMHAALDHLRAARTELQAADNDKGGHKAKALRNVNEAIEQVEKGIKFDRRH